MPAQVALSALVAVALIARAPREAKALITACALITPHARYQPVVLTTIVTMVMHVVEVPTSAVVHQGVGACLMGGARPRITQE